jgi:hypothetical protein
MIPVSKRSLSALVIVLTCVACGDDPASGPGALADAVVGEWQASGSFGALSFTTVESSEVIDWLARRAEVTVTLHGAGTTSGRLFIPGADEDGGDLLVEFAGTWRTENGRVRFEDEADTFIRDMSFALVGGRLVGDDTFGGVRVSLTLVRR